MDKMLKGNWENELLIEFLNENYPDNEFRIEAVNDPTTFTIYEYVEMNNKPIRVKWLKEYEGYDVSKGLTAEKVEEIDDIAQQRN